jgi:hypothetical protein
MRLTATKVIKINNRKAGITLTRIILARRVAESTV